MSAYKSAVYCEHANECPSGPCRCDPDCACRERMCQPDGFLEKSRRQESSRSLATIMTEANHLVSALGGGTVTSTHLVGRRLFRAKAALLDRSTLSNVHADACRAMALLVENLKAMAAGRRRELDRLLGGAP